MSLGSLKTSIIYSVCQSADEINKPHLYNKIIRGKEFILFRDEENEAKQDIIVIKNKYFIIRSINYFKFR